MAEDEEQDITAEGEDGSAPEQPEGSEADTGTPSEEPREEPSGAEEGGVPAAEAPSEEAEQEPAAQRAEGEPEEPPEEEPPGAAEREAAAEAPGEEPLAEEEPLGEGEQPAAEGEPSAEEEEPEEVVEEEGTLPPGLGGVRVPLVGVVPLWVVGIALGAAVMIFVGIVSYAVRTSAPPEMVRRPRAPAGEAGVSPPPPLPPVSPERLAEMDYEELLEKAHERVVARDYAGAEQLCREAAAREDEGIARVLLARHKLSRILSRTGQHKEALQLTDSLRAVSRPGDQLWKHALITSTEVLREQGRWKEYFRHLFLLRANSGRYADQAALNRWFAYQQAMAEVRLYLELAESARTLHGMQPPTFGQAPCECRMLQEGDIAVVTGKYGDGSVYADPQTGEFRLRAEGAPLSKVIAAVERATHLRVDYSGPAEHTVTASLAVISPERALEVALGSVGLQIETEDDLVTVGELDPRPRSAAEGLKASLWSAQEFLILYPESPNVAEAYYALGHLYMTQGKTRMALDQLEILCSQMPRSRWSAYAHYVAGLTWYEMEEWARAERDLLMLADGSPDHPLAPSAYLWAAQSQMKLEKYREAVSCFRRALAHEANQPLEPEILYNIAFCMERSGASALEVEERYLELRSRHPDSPFARRADYRLGRMALEAGYFEKAVARYEFFLNNWPLETEDSTRVCRDLIRAYSRCGDHVRAVMLGEVMAATFGYEDEYWQALPDLMECFREYRLLEMGVAVLDRATAATEDPQRARTLQVQKADLLLDMQAYDEAGAVLAGLHQQLKDPALKEYADLCRARLAMVRDPAQGVEQCKLVARKSVSESIRGRALRVLGEHFRRQNQFDRAALALCGKCPVLEGSEQP
ncbi:MAG: tetratricopeptide repeat protein [Candidatus Brocadiaceae bacterium]|jgi:tetratricopeptide (TPR) repeat protein